MRTISVLLVSTLALYSATMGKYRHDCDREAENAALGRLALWGLIDPGHLPEVRARLDALADEGSISDYLERSGLDDYAKVIESGNLDPFPSQERRPLWVFPATDGSGLVIFPNGYGYRVGSRYLGSTVIEISDQGIAIENARGVVEVIAWQGAFLRGVIVSEEGIRPATPLLRDAGGVQSKGITGSGHD